MERFYYKDNKGNLFNFKTPGFIKYKEIEEKFYWNDENGNPVLDENGEQRYDIEKKIVADGLLDGYTQITKEEYEKLTKPKELTAEQKAAYEKAKKIAEYKAYLEKTDYIVLKIAEAQSEGDTNTVSQLRDLYKEQLKERKRVRSLLN